MSELDTLRQRIDEADARLLAAFVERMRTADKIAECKRKSGGAIADASREERIIERVRKEAGAYADYAEALYYELFALSKQRQTELMRD